MNQQYYDVLINGGRAIPGSSLTRDPDNPAPYEKPPEYVSICRFTPVLSKAMSRAPQARFCSLPRVGEDLNLLNTIQSKKINMSRSGSQQAWASWIFAIQDFEFQCFSSEPNRKHCPSSGNFGADIYSIYQLYTILEILYSLYKISNIYRLYIFIVSKYLCCVYIACIYGV